MEYSDLVVNIIGSVTEIGETEYESLEELILDFQSRLNMALSIIEDISVMTPMEKKLAFLLVVTLFINFNYKMIKLYEERDEE